MCQIVNAVLLRTMIWSASGVMLALSTMFPAVSGAAFITIDVNYAENWIAGQTDAGASLHVFVRDSADVLKAESLMTAESDGSFFVDCDNWNSGECPDITPGDSVLVQVPGAQALVDPVGQITVIPDEVENTATGTITAPYTGSLAMECKVWETGGPTIVGTVDPQGGSYSCDFDNVGWDLQKSEAVTIAYIQPDGNRVISIATWPSGYVNYGDDTVGINYRAGYTFTITVTDADETVKATATATSQWGGGWWGNDGFSVSAGQWVPTVPDIIPGDRVTFLADNGYTNEIHVGSIIITFPPEDPEDPEPPEDPTISNTDSTYGTILAPDFAGLESLPVECYPWGGWVFG